MRRYDMRLSRAKLRRIIMENCALDAPAGEAPMDLAPKLDLPVETEPLAESSSPEADLMVEMEVASRALEQVVESVQNAAHLCPDCGEGISAQTPIMEAMVTQAEALQEMLAAQAEVVVESTEPLSAEISLVEL
jgi:hypothetical protein